MKTIDKNIIRIIPFIFTLSAVLLGVTAVIAVRDEYFFGSFAFALFALLSDTFDGYLARKWDTTTNLGAILDALADVIIYLIFPIIFMYQMDYRTSLLIFSFFVLFSFGIARLIRFVKLGIMKENSGGLYYLGLPVFWTHILVFLILLSKLFNLRIPDIFLFCLILGGSITMIGNFHFPKPKDLLYVAPPIFLTAIAFFVIEFYVS